LSSTIIPCCAKGSRRLVGGQADMTLAAECSNGREAVQAFRTHRPDVTLMDLQMPEMGGVDAIGAIRGEFSDAGSSCSLRTAATCR